MPLPCWVGKTHDYKMFQHEFPPEQKWFTTFTVGLDLGFVGFDKDYPLPRTLYSAQKTAETRTDAGTKSGK